MTFFDLSLRLRILACKASKINEPAIFSVELNDTSLIYTFLSVEELRGADINSFSNISLQKLEDGLLQQPNVFLPTSLIFSHFLNIGIPQNKDYETKIQTPKIKSRLYEERQIVIGIDFGTSGSKLIVRDDTTSNEPWIVFPETPAESYPKFVFPSMIGIEKDRLYFAGEAISQAKFKVSSLKVCFMCNADMACDDCVYSQSRIKNKKIINPKIGGDKIDIKEAVIFFIAYLICKSKDFVRRKLGNRGIRPKFFYNLGAPLERICSREKILFERALSAAHHIAGRCNITDGSSIEEMHTLYCEFDQNTSDVLDESERNYFVMPESYAATMSYFNSPGSQPGLYAIVDIGALTTDISVFRFESNPELSLAQTYATETFLLGINEIDRKILSNILESNGKGKINRSGNVRDMMYEIRRIRQAPDFGKDTKLGVAKEDIVKFSKDVGKEIRMRLRKTLGKGFEKEERQQNWPKLFLFIIGGGSKISVLEEILKLPLNLDNEGCFEINQLSETELIPKKLRIFNEKLEDQELLAVASGLSVHIANWLDFESPDDVPPAKFNWSKVDWEERIRMYND